LYRFPISPFPQLQVRDASNANLSTIRGNSAMKGISPAGFQAGNPEVIPVEPQRLEAPAGKGEGITSPNPERISVSGPQRHMNPSPTLANPGDTPRDAGRKERSSIPPIELTNGFVFDK
jgi:hypothetical protein